MITNEVRMVYNILTMRKKNGNCYLEKKRDILSIQEISLSRDFFQATHSIVKDMFCKVIIFNNYFKFFIRNILIKLILIIHLDKHFLKSKFLI